MKSKIFENVLIIYKNGVRELFEVISISVNGVYTGKKNPIYKKKNQFIKSRFIPKDQIQKIILTNENGKTKDLEF